MKKKIKALGIMNGTSLDAIDYALTTVTESLQKIQFEDHVQKEIPEDLRERLLMAASNKSMTYELSNLQFDLGRLYGQHAKELFAEWKWDVAGLHGQTVHHKGKEATLQIGHPGFIAHETQKPVYYDFRSADVVAKGQGAPFAPFFQKQLAKNLKKKNMTFHNLGGISNLTVIADKTVSAFDSGPANILMDAWISKKMNVNYDKDAKVAFKGLPDPLLVNHFLEHPFFQLEPPKSTGREEFNLDMIEQFGGLRFKRLSLEDQMATLLEVTALSIVQCYDNYQNDLESIYFYGGGTSNPLLMKRLAFLLGDIQLSSTDELGWPSQAFEAATFAFLAAARYYNVKVHLPEVTGAEEACHLGSVYF